MPLPFILGLGAAIAGVVGIGSGIAGAANMADANDKMKAAESRHKKNIERFETTNKATSKTMDELGTLELQILDSFKTFSNIIERIQNRPEFDNYNINGVKLPKYNKEELREVSVGAGVLLGGLGGATLGTAGGFAAAGATTSAVMALGTASTGTAIASLSGVAATNATLAALGGGSLAAGGGGMALGSTILGATTLGVGLLVGGVIFGLVGDSISSKADEAYNQMKEAEDKINQICLYLTNLSDTAQRYNTSLVRVRKKYYENFNPIYYKVNYSSTGKLDWYDFNQSERLMLQNSSLLVKLLYKMCKVNLVIKAKDENTMNEINIIEVNDALRDSDRVLNNMT